MDDSILIRKDLGAVRLLTINRPEAANALNIPLLDALEIELQAIEQDASIRTVILTGTGNRAFVGGADVTELQSLSPLSAVSFSRRGHDVMHHIETLPIPVIAAVNGFALGGGLELALACDFIYAAQSATLGLVEANLGLIPGYGGVGRLTHRIGESAAREALFTARHFTADEALNNGLVNRVIADDKLITETVKTAEFIAEKSPEAIQLLRTLFLATRGCDPGTMRSIEQQKFGLAFATEDCREGISAFLEKRDPEFLRQRVLEH